MGSNFRFQNSCKQSRSYVLMSEDPVIDSSRSIVASKPTQIPPSLRKDLNVKEQSYIDVLTALYMDTVHLNADAQEIMQAMVDNSLGGDNLGLRGLLRQCIVSRDDQPSEELLQELDVKLDNLNTWKLCSQDLRLDLLGVALRTRKAEIYASFVEKNIETLFPDPVDCRRATLLIAHFAATNYSNKRISIEVNIPGAEKIFASAILARSDAISGKIVTAERHLAFVLKVTEGRPSGTKSIMEAMRIFMLFPREKLNDSNFAALDKACLQIVSLTNKNSFQASASKLLLGALLLSTRAKEALRYFQQVKEIYKLHYGPGDHRLENVQARILRATLLIGDQKTFLKEAKSFGILATLRQLVLILIRKSPIKKKLFKK